VKRTAVAVPCSLQYVYSILHRAGKWGPHRRMRPLHGKEVHIHRLHQGGRTLSQLASKYNVSKVAIFKALRRAKRARYLDELTDRDLETAFSLRGVPMVTRLRNTPYFLSARAMDRKIGNRLRLRRKTMRWSRAKLAHSLNIAVRDVQAFEKGGIGITTSTLYALACVFQVPLRSFLSDLLPQFDEFGDCSLRGRPSEDKTDTQMSRELSELLAAYNQIDNLSVRKQVHELVMLLGSE